MVPHLSHPTVGMLALPLAPSCRELKQRYQPENSR